MKIFQISLVHTPIKKDRLLKAGFKNLSGDTWRLTINLPYDGLRFIEVGETPKGLIAYYMVNNVPASKIVDTLKDLDLLYLALTGKELAGR